MLCPGQPHVRRLALTILFLLAASSGLAAEPAQEFLEGLRTRGYHEMALEYLDAMRNSPLAPPEFKEVLDLEKAVTLVAASRSERDTEVRVQQLDQAQQLLRQFIDQHKQHAKANAARTQLGNLIVERARLKVEESKKGNAQQLLAEARKLYEEAYKVFGEQQAEIAADLEKIPNALDVTDEAQAKLADRRTQLRADFLQTQLLAAAIREEMADTVPPESKEHQNFLAEAATQYEEIYKKYRTRLAGLYARMYQGRANQKMGKYRDALGFYVELLDQPDEPEAFRVLKTKTLRLAMDAWLHPSENKYVEAIRRGSEWLLKAKAHEERQADWLYIRLAVARAYVAQSEDAQKSSPPDRRLVTSSLNEARKHAQAVARYESEFQPDAHKLVAELGGPDRTDDSPVAQNFSQARKAGSEALDAIQPASVAVQQLKSQLASAEEAQKAELQQQLAQAEQSLQAARDNAVRFFRLALQLADQDTSIEDINLVRYLLSYLYYTQQMYYDAALMGEFVARRYPDSTGARQCAKIAMACYLQLYNQADAEQRQFETNRIVGIADYVVGKWPGNAEAEEALATLIPFMINDGQIAKARQYLEQLPTSSSRWADAALKTGKAMWQTYLQGVQDLQTAQKDGNPQGIDVAARQAELEQLKIETQQTLQAAVDALPEEMPLDESLLTSLLSLAQADVETQQAAAALEVLEHPQRGPLTLVRKNHPASRSQGIREETYKTALRAHIASLAGSPDREKSIEAAKKIMDEMRTELGATPAGQERLIAVYVGLARDLEEQLRVASPEAKQALSQGFEAFLNQLSTTATELNVLNWVAETFASLGAGFDTGSESSPQAELYYAQAADAFQNILDKAELTPEMRTQVRVRLAGVRKSQRQYDEALAIFADILRENNMTLNVQVEAAHTLQQAGRLEEAILGAVAGADGKNVIWGWGKVAQVTARFPKFKDIFHQARYNLAAVRFQQAQQKQGDERSKLLEMAAKDISLTKRLYGTGDPQQTQRYDALLKEIQQSSGQPAVGLEAFETATTSAKT